VSGQNDQGNPYAPPQAEVNAGLGAGSVDELPTAGMGARLLNVIIDYVIFLVLLTIIAVSIRLIRPGMDESDAPGTVFGLALMAGYYFVFEWIFGWTIGKLITGTRVVAEDDGKPTLGQMIGRTLLRFLPFEPFSLLFSKSNEAWHDSLSGTRVVKVRR
jgi:uncharacterized RDD family membrane protein YckC